ncbi:NlpC/P60 family protein [Metaclostridioides mangenotii]|uniref:NlpC/P60 family protein n=1 Tax=Metaclostridioides mangenotii TaxID=1540 RepID=UPI0026EC9FB6|nr:NlpC/P60 family protein [Clostridioides mangenotii]
MRKKIFAPVFATAVALSASIVSYANPADYSQQNQDVEKIDMTETQEYQDVRFKTAVVKDGVAVNVRNEQEDGQVQNVAYSGESFKVLGKQGEWLKVENGSLEGWMSAKYLDLKVCDGYVDASRLNFRSEEGTDSEVFEVLDYGTAITVLEDNGEWLKVKHNEQEGYIFSKYVTDKSPIVDEYNAGVDSTQSTVPELQNKGTEENGSPQVNGTESNGTTEENVTESSESDTNTNSENNESANSGSNSSEEESNDSSSDVPASSSSSVQSVLNLAYSKQGLPYVWGAEGPNSFDCSGFTKYVFNNSAGVSIPRTSKEQAKFGQTVSKSNLQPGDMVFFTTDGSGQVSHVGIYVGGGSMIHAPSSGKNIKVTSIESDYYTQRFVTAKRVL